MEGRGRGDPRADRGKAEEEECGFHCFEDRQDEKLVV